MTSLLLSPLFTSQVSALSVYQPSLLSPDCLPSLASVSWYFYTFTFKSLPLSSSPLFFSPLLSHKGQIKTQGSILPHRSKGRRGLEARGWGGGSQYLHLWCCAPPSWLRTRGWSSVWVEGLWCCRPGWLPQVRTTALRICPLSLSARQGCTIN